MPRPGTIHRRRDLFDEARAVIDKDYASNLTLTVVAHRVGTSVRQLQRVFADAGGTTFRRYLIETRMAAATPLLEHGELRIRDIARAVGYYQPGQFTKAYQRELGIAPSTLRRAGARPAPTASSTEAR